MMFQYLMQTLVVTADSYPTHERVAKKRVGFLKVHCGWGWRSKSWKCKHHVNNIPTVLNIDTQPIIKTLQKINDNYN